MLGKPDGLLGIAMLMAVPYSAEHVPNDSIAVAAAAAAAPDNLQTSPPVSKHPLHPGDIAPVSSEWIAFPENGCFYKIVSRPMIGWAAARESCARFADGADLASITDESELRFLSQSSLSRAVQPPWWVGGFSSGPAADPPPCPKSQMALLQSRCLVSLEEATWRWSDGSFFDQHRMWGPGEPSARSIGFCTLQGYETIGMRDHHFLNDEHCMIRRKYACKWCPELPAHVEPPVMAMPKTACAEVELRDTNNGVNPWDADKTVELQWLSCPKGTVVTSVLFASVGRPYGKCSSKVQSAVTANPYCHADAKAVVEHECLGKEACGPAVSKALLGDPCSGQNLRFVARVKCANEVEAGGDNQHSAILTGLVNAAALSQHADAAAVAEKLKDLANSNGAVRLRAETNKENGWGHDVLNVIMPLKLCRTRQSSVGGPPCECKPNCLLCRNHKHKNLKTCFKCSNGKILDGRPSSKYTACVAECPAERPAKYGTAANGFFCGSPPSKVKGRPLRVDPNPAMCLSDGLTAIGRAPCKCPEKCELCTLGSGGSQCYRCSIGFDLGVAGAACQRDTTQLGVKRAGTANEQQ